MKSYILPLAYSQQFWRCYFKGLSYSFVSVCIDVLCCLRIPFLTMSHILMFDNVDHPCRITSRVLSPTSTTLTPSRSTSQRVSLEGYSSQLWMKFRWSWRWVSVVLVHWCRNNASSTRTVKKDNSQLVNFWWPMILCCKYLLSDHGGSEPLFVLIIECKEKISSELHELSVKSLWEKGSTMGAFKWLNVSSCNTRCFLSSLSDVSDMVCICAYPSEKKTKVYRILNCFAAET